MLAAGTKTVAVGLAGCLQALEAGDGGPSRSDEDPLYPDDRDVPDDAGTHDLYVENYDDVVHEVTLSVVRASDDALVWRAVYDAPDRRGFSIPDLLVGGRTYEVTLDVTDGPGASNTRTIEACSNSEGGSETRSDGGSKNLGVWIDGGTITFEQDNCDEINVGVRLNYGDHESFIAEDDS